MLPTLAWQLSPQTRLHTPRERLLKILELKCIVIHMIQIWTSVCIINIRGFSTCVIWVYFGLKMRFCFVFVFSICVQPLCGIGKELFSGMGIVCKNAYFCGCETDSTERKNCLQGKEIGGGEKEGSTSFSSDHEIYGAHAHTAVTHLNHLIVNTVTAVTLAGMH